MSLSDRLGAPSAHSAQTDAIAWVRSSIYSRFGRSMRYRSRFSVAIMYAAELAAGDVKTGRRAKLEEGRADCEAASIDELQLGLDVLRAARKAAPDDLARAWASRADAVLSEIARGKIGAPTPSLQPISPLVGVAPSPRPPATPANDGARTARYLELVNVPGADPHACMAQALAEHP